MSVDRVCVHGLGYIGLPTAAVLADTGYEVYGYDINDDVVADLESRQLPEDEPGLASLVADVLDSGALTPVRECVQAEFHVICVPTGLADDKTADLSAVREAAKTISPTLRSGDTVIVESTVPPGTTIDIVEPLLEQRTTGTRSEFKLVYSPETVLPGRILTELRANDRLVGGVDESSTAAGVELYESFVDGTLHETDATTAEFAKLAQNTYRDANIALANEFAKLARTRGIDSREVIALGNTHPRVDIHQPGPGPGGHCLPVDPWFLCEDVDGESLIGTARRVNDGMVSYVADVIAATLGDLTNHRIALLGAAYKGGVSDIRHSPGLRLADELRNRREATVRMYDPYITDPELTTSTLADAVRNADALVVTTGHEEYAELSPTKVAEQMRQQNAIDTKNILNPPEWRAAGFDLTSL